MNTCIFCGEPAVDYIYIGHSKVFYCEDCTCLEALEDAMHDHYLWEKEELECQQWKDNQW